MDLSDRPLLSYALVPGQEGQVVIGAADHAAYLCDVRSLRLLKTLYSKQAGHTEWVTSIAVTPQYIVTGGMDSAIWCWPRRTAKQPFSLTGSAITSSLRGTAATTTTTSVGYPITVLRTIEDHHIVAGDYTGVVTKYDLTRKEATATWKRKTARRIPVADIVVQGGNQVITSYKDGALMIWSDAGLEPVASVRAHAHSSIQLADLDEDRLFAVAGDDAPPPQPDATTVSSRGYLRIFDRAQSLTKPLRTILAHADGPGVVGVLTVSPHDRAERQKHLLSYGGEDASASIKLYRHADGFHPETLYKGTNGRIMDAIAVDAKTVATAWSTGRLLVHDLSSKEVLAEFEAPSVIIRVLCTAGHLVALTEKGTLSVFPYTTPRAVVSPTEETISR